MIGQCLELDFSSQDSPKEICKFGWDSSRVHRQKNSPLIAQFCTLNHLPVTQVGTLISRLKNNSSSCIGAHQNEELMGRTMDYYMGVGGAISGV